MQATAMLCMGLVTAHEQGTRADECSGPLAYRVERVGSPVVRAIHLNQYAGAADEDVTTKQAIISHVIDGMGHSYAGQHMCNIVVVRSSLAGLHILHQSLQVTAMIAISPKAYTGSRPAIVLLTCNLLQRQLMQM